MKCLFLFVLYLSCLFSNVCSLSLTITTLVGKTAVVQWTRNELDPDPLSFDLRFVIPPYYDVGLAMAGIRTSSVVPSGNITVQFPNTGKYMLVAVSGQNYLQIAQTAAIEVPGTPPTPSPTPSSPSIPPSPSKSITTTRTACPKKNINVPAIVFAVLGGVSLIGLLTFAVIYLIRRRRLTEDKRISFHRERMVQQSFDPNNPSVGRVGGCGGVIIPYAFAHPRASLSSESQSDREARPHDIEQGLAVPPPIMTSLPWNPSGSKPNTPLASGHTVPPPRGPRDRATSIRRVESPRVSRVNGEPTSRQRQLAAKLVEVEKRLLEVKSQPQPLPSTVVLLEDLELQKAWLVKQRDSMWALEEIDTLPPGYSRYMT